MPKDAKGLSQPGFWQCLGGIGEGQTKIKYNSKYKFGYKYRRYYNKILKK
jgi:hypothetical protein